MKSSHLEDARQTAQTARKKAATMDDLIYIDLATIQGLTICSDQLSCEESHF